MIAVPLHYRGRTVGAYNLFVEEQGLVAREDIKELLTSVGNHLGAAIEKVRLDEEANRLSIMEERTRLAYELHDSLAPTHGRLDASAICGVRCNRSDSGSAITAAPIPWRPPQNPLTVEGVVQMGSGTDMMRICF